MGKNYYCEYCDKRVKNDAQVIKKHIAGLAHTAARNDHFAKYKGETNNTSNEIDFICLLRFYILDPQTILTEESQKTPCQRFFRGDCKFGGNCRFSHYTADELSKLHYEGSSSLND